jgi:uncharacterized protein
VKSAPTNHLRMERINKMDRLQAIVLLKENLQDETFFAHSLAVEAIMRALAQRLNGDMEKWGLAGLLHDIDYQAVQGDMKRHGAVGYGILKKAGVDEEVAQAVLRHNEDTGNNARTVLEKALQAADYTTWLIFESVKAKPEMRLSAVDTDFVMRKMGEKSFAKGANRDKILACVGLGVPLEEYIAMSIHAMQGIAEKIGL